MLMYSDEDVEADSYLMLPPSSGKNSRLLSTSHCKATLQKPNNIDSLYKAVQSHLDCGSFLTFAEKAVGVELAKSNQYSGRIVRPNLQALANADNSHNEIQGKYCKRHLRDIFDLLPLSLQVSEINKMPESSIFMVSSSSKDAGLKQLRRDVERDKFVINDVQLNGSEKHLEGICDNLVQCCNSALLKCCLLPISKEVENHIAYEVLQKACRTNSGGIAYQCLQYLIDSSSVVIVPVSTLAQPLSINVSIGSYKDSTNHCEHPYPELPGYGEDDRWGLICRVECSTFFKLERPVDEVDSQVSLSESLIFHESEDLIVQILYENEICFDVNICSKCSIETLSSMTGTSMDSGRVTVSHHKS
mmetsp:Transcript_10959/g.10595  ORF Transcript_10959/g.10595 Transcript_10959/m.10595 type:complete len:360 (+) Transcript_10959:61-1140(+)